MPVAASKITELIQSNFGLTVIQNTLVSYVTLLQGHRSEPRCSFVCIQRKERIPKSKNASKSPKCQERSEEDLDLTGSPLKDNFQIEIVNMSIETKGDFYKPWTDVEESYCGVNVNIARSIVSELGDAGLVSGPVWFLCDFHDTERTILVENEFDANWWSRGSVVRNDPVPLESIQMDQLMAIHLNRFPELKTFDTDIDSTYHLRHNIHVRVEMSFQKQLPSFTFFQGAKVYLRQFLAKPDESLKANSFWCDILILNYIRRYILDYPSSNANEPLYECGTGMRLREIKEEIATLFTTVVFSTDLNDQGTMVVGEQDLDAVVAGAISRDFTDITDSLWNLLKCCGSYHDLKVAFNYMFHFVQMNNIVNIPANKNHLATLIKEISEGRLTNLCLSGTDPLELLLEIGMEKVEKDYEHIFIRSKTTTVQDLHSCSNFYKENVIMKSDGQIRKSVFHSSKNNKISQATASRTTLLTRAKDLDRDDESFHYSDFDENEVEVKLCKLAHFHGILEHLLQLKAEFNNVDVFTLIMEHMLQQPMHYPFRVVEQRGFKDLEMEVINNSLLKLVKEKAPNIRRVSLTSKKALIEVKSTFVHSLDPIFPGDVGEVAVDFGREDKDERTITQQLYFNYFYRNVRTKC